jgi:two-component system NtrC family response regulator
MALATFAREMTLHRILLVAQRRPEREGLLLSLAERGYQAMEAATCEEALGVVARVAPEAIVTDAMLPDATAEALVRGVRALGSDAAVVVAAGPAEIDAAVEAMRAGAESYLVRPLDPTQAVLILEKALEKRRLRLDTARLRQRVRERYSLVGTAPELEGIQEIIRRAAPTKATVLVQGETGTGRELVAQALHEASPRRDRPFVRVNCAALSEALLESELFGHEQGAFADAAERKDGRLEQADGGTLFLHEIGHASQTVQVKLLRVLQQGEFERVGGRETIKVDVRVVASTHHDVGEEVRAGRFRDDLYYRLNVVTLALPPLRLRKGDIPVLATHFIDMHARALGKHVAGVSPGALSALFAYEWPGNVRELENVIEQAVRACATTEIGADDLSPVLHGARPEEQTTSALIPGATLFEIEREAILRTLDVVEGSTARAAEILGISVRKIQYRLKEYRSGQAARPRRPADPVLPAYGAAALQPRRS